MLLVARDQLAVRKHRARMEPQASTLSSALAGAVAAKKHIDLSAKRNQKSVAVHKTTKRLCINANGGAYYPGSELDTDVANTIATRMLTNPNQNQSQLARAVGVAPSTVGRVWKRVQAGAPLSDVATARARSGMTRRKASLGVLV